MIHFRQFWHYLILHLEKFQIQIVETKILLILLNCDGNFLSQKPYTDTKKTELYCSNNSAVIIFDSTKICLKQTDRHKQPLSSKALDSTFDNILVHWHIITTRKISLASYDNIILLSTVAWCNSDGLPLTSFTWENLVKIAFRLLRLLGNSCFQLHWWHYVLFSLVW